MRFLRPGIPPDTRFGIVVRFGDEEHAPNLRNIRDKRRTYVFTSEGSPHPGGPDWTDRFYLLHSPRKNLWLLTYRPGGRAREQVAAWCHIADQVEQTAVAEQLVFEYVRAHVRHRTFCRIEMFDDYNDFFEADWDSAIRAADDTGETELHAAARAGDVASLKRLVDRGADLSTQDNDRRTPLHVAAMHLHVEAVTFLLQNGCDPKATDSDGATPFDLAAPLADKQAASQIASLLNDSEVSRRSP